MAVPGYQEFMLPILDLAGDGKEHLISDAMQIIAQRMRLSDEDRVVRLPSGTQTRYYNRFTWAVSYLTKSALLERVGRAKFRITARGQSVLNGKPAKINNAFLEQFEEFRQFKTKKRANNKEEASEQDGDELSNVTPNERLEAAHRELSEALADDLLERIRSSSPKFFERLVVDLLVAMNYGGANPGAAEVVGKSGDGGIDGVIPEDKLGLDMVYVQAKKWENSVGPDEIRKFVGSLGERKAHKGVFITSGAFTTGAKTAAERANVRIALIDGDQLAKLMIAHSVGVSDQKSYRVQKLDTDYFDEE